MDVRSFDIAGPLLITPKRFGDERGFFSEVFRQDVLEPRLGPLRFVQDNHSRSSRRGTIRGLHYQAPPRAQGKLVRCTRGAVYDVAVDVRTGSPTYGRHVVAELSKENWAQLWVPPGFLHGFCTLTDDAEVLYKVTDYFSAEHDGAVAHDDPVIGIAWPVPPAERVLSDKDRRAPPLSALGPVFAFVD